MRETKRFLVDNLSHHPELKLEWVCIDEDSTTDHIVRASEIPKKSKKSKGKEKATVAASESTDEAFPLLPLDAWEALGESDDEDDDVGPLKLEMIEGVHFSDVWGVRIFKKEVMAGRL